MSAFVLVQHDYSHCDQDKQYAYEGSRVEMFVKEHHTQDHCCDWL